MSPYNEPGYRAERARIRAMQPPCWHGCGRAATTPDHVPPLAAHDHRPGADCCQLLPACEHCQYSSGARYGNRRRAARVAYAVRRW